MKKLFIIGFGVGNEELLTLKAISVLKQADFVITTANRFFDVGTADRKILGYINMVVLPLSEIYKVLEMGHHKTIAVLVSGDVNFYSVSTVIKEKFGTEYEINFTNGISSLQYFSSKILENYDAWKILSVHGRDKSIIPYVCYNKKVFLLTGGDNKAHSICKELVKAELKSVRVTIGENLSYAAEKIVSGEAETLQNKVFSDLSVMLIENSDAIDHSQTIRDTEFIREDIPMTKEDVRWSSLQKLSVKPTSIVYDIGAGTGSVSIELARKAYESTVYSIEEKTSAVELIKKNKEKHKAYNISVIHGMAPDVFEDLPNPDRVFIGGSSGKIENIINSLCKKNTNFKIVINAVTLQTLQRSIELLNEYSFKNIDIVCINVAKSKKIKNYDMMLAENPIYVISGDRINEEKDSDSGNK